MHASTATPRLGWSVTSALATARAPLLYGVRLWASVCLALFVAFWLELDNPFWTGSTAAIVCLPQLGASLRKGWFRMIGTVVGAVAIVVLTACFPHDRIAFLGGLALWGGLCAFVATVLRNFASYAAALAGFTAAIMASDTLGATGGPSPDVFMLAVWRASEICIGIVCAGIVIAGTDLGGARPRLAASLANLAAEILGGFTGMLALAGSRLPDTRTERRELLRRVSALEPMIDEARGESSDVRYQSPMLQAAIHGLFRTLVGWRSVATHLSTSPNDMNRQVAETVLRCIPPELRSPPEAGATAYWIADPIALRRGCDAAARTLLAQPAGTPSRRLLADETAKMLAGMSRVLDGLALLVGTPGRSPPGVSGFRTSVADWLPALVNAARAVITISAVELLWVVTAWPSGVYAIVFVAVVVLLLSPRGELAYGFAIAFTLGIAVDVPCVAIAKFAVLPAFQTFAGFCAALGFFLVPMGSALVWSRQPAVTAVLTAMTMSFITLLAPTNPMSYDTTQFYNSALAIVAGCGISALAIWLLPPLSPALRARRLLAFTLRDLRRMAIARRWPEPKHWEGRMYSRLTTLPDQAEPVQRARLLAAVSVGNAIIQLRHLVPHLGASAALDAALESFAQGNSASAIARLHRLDEDLAAAPVAGADTASTLRTRGCVLVIVEALAEHGAYFDAEAFS